MGKKCVVEKFEAQLVIIEKPVDLGKFQNLINLKFKWLVCRGQAVLDTSALQEIFLCDKAKIVNVDLVKSLGAGSIGIFELGWKGSEKEVLEVKNAQLHIQPRIRQIRAGFLIPQVKSISTGFQIYVFVIWRIERIRHFSLRFQYTFTEIVDRVLLGGLHHLNRRLPSFMPGPEIRLRGQTG